MSYQTEVKQLCHSSVSLIQNTLIFFCSSTEGELEAEWLQDVGLSTLISGSEEEDGEALLSTLTRTQAAAVQKRYNTYTQTMRKKNKHTVRDVRDIFGISDTSVSRLLSGLEGNPLPLPTENLNRSFAVDVSPDIACAIFASIRTTTVVKKLKFISLFSYECSTSNY